MCKEEKCELLLDEEDRPILVEGECREFGPIIEDFVKSYLKDPKQSVRQWLASELHNQLPDKTSDETEAMADEILDTIKINEEKRESLNKAVKDGRSKENWFASDMKQVLSGMSTKESVRYMETLDDALRKANDSLYRTITTKTGTVSQNPCLDGFIAEQYHAQTFNLNAEATGSPYRAKVLEANGKGYAKNSVDIVIADSKGKIVSRYQSKYCKNAKATEQAFEHGDYRGQQKLVPKGQETEISKKSTTVLKAPDGTTSNALTKPGAEQMQKEAQSGKWNELNWNEYATKDLAVGIGKQAGYAALQGVAIGVGFDVAQKIWNGEPIKTDEVVETAIVSGMDFGIKAAAAGALKVGVEKNIINVIPKGTPATVYANIAFVAVEDAKVLYKIASDEISMKEGIEKIQQTTVSTLAGLMAMGKGTAIGAQIGLTFGPVGAAIGGFVGGTIGYMAGSKVGEKVVKCAQKVRDKTIKVAKKVFSKIKDMASSLEDNMQDFRREMLLM